MRICQYNQVLGSRTPLLRIVVPEDARMPSPAEQHRSPGAGAWHSLPLYPRDQMMRENSPNFKDAKVTIPAGKR